MQYNIENGPHISRKRYVRANPNDITTIKKQPSVQNLQTLSQNCKYESIHQNIYQNSDVRDHR